MWIISVLVLLSFLCRPSEEQTFPYVSIGDQVLPNHSFVNMSLVGTSIDSAIQCHTDVATCCSATQGSRRANWLSPGGDKLLFPGEHVVLYQSRDDRRVDLYRRSGSAMSGIYCCQIPTSSSSNRLYVGLYMNGGDVTIPEAVNLTITSDLNGPTPQFTLTCISTGGPATTVTWTRDSTTVTEGTETVLNDPVTAQYTHTLTVTGRFGTHGLYTCSVSNNKPSSDSAQYIVQIGTLPTNLKAVQEGVTSILVSWTPPTPPGHTTGYRVCYISESNNNCSEVGNTSTESYLLTGLTNGEQYSITVHAMSQHLPGESTNVVAVSLVPGQPNVSVGSETATSVTVSWSVSPDSVVTSYEVSWERDTSGACPDEDRRSDTTNGTSFLRDALEEDSMYFIRVRAFNGAGGSTEGSTAAKTLPAAPDLAPASITVLDLTFSSVTVQWEQVECIHRNGDITSYLVEYGEDRDGGEIHRLGVPGSSQSTTITGLSPSTVYSIKIAAITVEDKVGPSDLIRVQTQDAISAVADSIQEMSVVISWDLYMGVIPTSYIISYFNINNTECFNDVENLTTTNIESGTAFRVSNLQENTTYSITITVVFNNGSTVSDNLTVTTLPAVPSGAPSWVGVKNVTSLSVTVQWGPLDCKDLNGHLEGYSVRYGVVGSGNTQEVLITDSAAVAVTLLGLYHSSYYSIELATVNSVGVGVYSTPITVATTSSVSLTLNGQTIPDHGYVLISDIGSSNTTALVCHTNLPASTVHSGDWFSSDGTFVGGMGSNEVPGFVRNGGPMEVRLLRNITTDPPIQGIYHCDIVDSSQVWHSLYVGLYNSGEGNVSVDENVSLSVDVDSSGISLGFTLTCVSTGGPATNVTWKRDSTAITEGTDTVLDDSLTAQYTHTLNVTGRLGGLYSCTVSNSIASASSFLLVQAPSPPTGLVAVQVGLDSIQLSWTPPSQLRDITGYRINYHSIGFMSTVNISDSSTNTLLLTGLDNGVGYHISILTTSTHLTSNKVETSLTLIRPPDQPSVTVTAISSNSISLSWSVPSDSVVTSSEVSWTESERNTTYTSGSIAVFSYTLTELQENTIYSVVVRVANVAGSRTNQIAITTTEKANTDNDDRVELIFIIGGVVIGVLVMITCIVLIVLVVVLRHSKKHKVLQSATAPTSPVRVMDIQEDTQQKEMELATLPDEPFYEAPITIINTANNVAYRSKEQLVAENEGYDVILTTHPGV